MKASLAGGRCAMPARGDPPGPGSVPAGCAPSVARARRGRVAVRMALHAWEGVVMFASSGRVRDVARANRVLRLWHFAVGPSGWPAPCGRSRGRVRRMPEKANFVPGSWQLEHSPPTLVRRLMAHRAHRIFAWSWQSWHGLECGPGDARGATPVTVSVAAFALRTPAVAKEASETTWPAWAWQSLQVAFVWCSACENSAPILSGTAGWRCTHRELGTSTV